MTYPKGSAMTQIEILDQLSKFLWDSADWDTEHEFEDDGCRA
jgi:hypothetical protein